MLTTIQAFSQDFKKKFGVTLSLSDLVDKWMLVSHQGNITNCWGGRGGYIAMDKRNLFKVKTLFLST